MHFDPPQLETFSGWWMVECVHIDIERVWIVVNLLMYVFLPLSLLLPPTGLHDGEETLTHVSETDSRML